MDGGENRDQAEVSARTDPHRGTGQRVAPTAGSSPTATPTTSGGSTQRSTATAWSPTSPGRRTGPRHGPDHRFGDGDRIGPFEAVDLPGHEPDNHALVDEAAGLAILGEALSGADQRGLPPGSFYLPPAVYSDDLDQAEAGLERRQDDAFDVGLVYHGSSVLENARGVIDEYVSRIPGT